MLERERTRLKKTIVIKAIIILLLIILIIIFGMKSAIKISERNIYNAISFEYTNLSFDKELSKIAESCAQKCYDEQIEAKDVRILENEQFVKLYSADCHVTKYTVASESDDDFLDTFFSAMKTDKYAETNSRLQKCQYIGVGKYKTQIFILAFYND